MKKVKTVKKFIIFRLNANERREYGFEFAPILKETAEAYASNLSPSDAYIECETFDQAVSWAENY